MALARREGGGTEKGREEKTGTEKKENYKDKEEENYKDKEEGHKDNKAHRGRAQDNKAQRGRAQDRGRTVQMISRQSLAEMPGSLTFQRNSDSLRSSLFHQIAAYPSPGDMP